MGATLTGQIVAETYEALLKVTDNGIITGTKKRITDGFGKKIDCKNLIIIATSNATNYQNYFQPEFLNRFDGVITYNSLTSQSLYELAKKMIGKIVENLYKLYRIKVTVSEVTIQNIINMNKQTEYGARNLERTISQLLEDKISKMILEDKVKEGDVVEL